MTIPRPAADARSLDSWGFILFYYDSEGFDWHSKFWFDSRLEMICFLCLGADVYLHSSDESPEGNEEWKRRRHNVENAFLPTVEASYQGEQEFYQAVQKVARLMGDVRLAWCGQFKDIAKGEHGFPVKIREKFLEGSGWLLSMEEFWADDRFDQFNEWLRSFEGFKEPK